jgi:hypothetical protein
MIANSTRRCHFLRTGRARLRASDNAAFASPTAAAGAAKRTILPIGVAASGASGGTDREWRGGLIAENANALAFAVKGDDAVVGLKLDAPDWLLAVVDRTIPVSATGTHPGSCSLIVTLTDTRSVESVQLGFVAILSAIDYHGPGEG